MLSHAALSLVTASAIATTMVCATVMQNLQLSATGQDGIEPLQARKPGPGRSSELFSRRMCLFLETIAEEGRERMRGRVHMLDYIRSFQADAIKCVARSLCLGSSAERCARMKTCAKLVCKSFAWGEP